MALSLLQSRKTRLRATGLFTANTTGAHCRQTQAFVGIFGIPETNVSGIQSLPRPIRSIGSVRFIEALDAIWRLPDILLFDSEREYRARH